MNSPTFEDVKAAERIVRYINGTLDHGVTFSGTDTQLNAWADASFESERGGFSRSSIVFSLGKASGAFFSKSFTQLIRSLSLDSRVRDPSSQRGGSLRPLLPLHSQ